MCKEVENAQVFLYSPVSNCDMTAPEITQPQDLVNAFDLCYSQKQENDEVSSDP